MKIANTTGSPVEGVNFYGREKELEYAINKIEQGDSIILAAPRRVGKSSFAKKILAELKQKGWNTFEINLEEINSEEGFVRLFVESIQNETWWSRLNANGSEKLTQILESIKSTVEIDGVKASLEWKSKKTDVYEKLKKLLDHSEKTVIMVDELTVLLNCIIKSDKENGVEHVEYFLNWLRSFRQKSGTKIRWVFCSSIGIDNFANQYGLSYTINDVPSFPLEAFKRPKALSFIQALSDSLGLGLKDEHNEYILDKIVWHLPYFIQILIEKLNVKISVHELKLNNDLIDQAYELLMTVKELNTWEERIKNYGLLENYARHILLRLSIAKEGESRNILSTALQPKIEDEDERNLILSRLLYMLQNDGYIDMAEEKYAFRSPIIRDFWHHRFNK